MNDKSFTKTCTCGKTIVLYLTPNGKWIPTEPGLKSVYDPKTGEVYQGFTPHHIHCPHADKHRKKKGE